MKKVLKKYIALIKGFNKEIVKTWNENDSEAALTYVKNNGIQVECSGNMKFTYYSLVKMTEYKMKSVIYTEKDYFTNNFGVTYNEENYFTTRDFAFKEDTIEKYKLTEIDDYLNEKHLWNIYHHMLNEFNIPYIIIKTIDGTIKHYTNLEKFEKLVEAVNVKQQPLVIEGTDWPYWFNFEGSLIPSNTSNWFKYLQTKFNYISPASLVPYTGDDMYDKYLPSKIVKI